jgi:hypothetical protein
VISADDLVAGSPTAGETVVDQPPRAEHRHPDRTLVTLLKLTAAAEKAVAALRDTTLPDGTRTLLDDLDRATRDSWALLGPQHRLDGTGG